MSENTAKQKTRRKRKGMFRAIRRIVKWIVILAILLAAGLFGLKAYIRKNAQDSGDAQRYARAQAVRGALSDTVYGTGTTSAVSQPSVLAEADGTLTELHVAIGDAVKAGDILAVITNASIDDTITDLEFALWELDDQIKETRAGSKVYTIEAPVAGRVMALYAQKGDDALAVFRREGALALISTDGRMKVELAGDSKLPLALGETVTLTGDTVAASGTVTDLTRHGTHATITVLGDEYTMGETVAVVNAAGEIVGSGEMQINKPMAVSSYGGTIASVAVEVGDTVKREGVIYKLEDSPLTLTIESLRLQRETAARDLETAKAQRENLVVIAPCDGVVATVDVTEGTEIAAGTLLFSILEGEEMKLTIAVDELDVVSVEAGQKVNITVDAFPDAQFAGEVAKIAPVGTNSGGVTTYDVQLAFEAEGTGVRSGMNATGEITIAQKSDALFVPVEALMTMANETYVMVEDTGAAIPAFAPEGMIRGERFQMGDMPGMKQQTREESGTIRERALKAYEALRAWLYEDAEQTVQQPSGALVKVTTGLQNDEYVEITSGLSEGDVVLYAASEEDSRSMFGGSNRGGMNMGGFGGMPMGF